ncbi:MAG: proline dehydrogenase family protein [Desulfobacteraceae bacterium]
MLNTLISRTLPFIPKSLVWQFSKNYIAGETSKGAIEASRALNSEGIKVTLDILGEFIETLDQAEKNKEEYLELIRIVEQSNLDGNYSIKPTMFGLLIDEEVCYQHVRQLVKAAHEQNTFIRIDMENSPCVDPTITLFRKVKAEFPENVGLVLQAYLKRTRDDIKSLLDLSTAEVPLNIRLCKGIYVEPSEIAYKDYHEINRHYLEDLELMFKNGLYSAIATHDKPLISGAMELIEKYNAPKESYEFQMLYGVTPKQRKSIVESGHTMRVYIPFGTHWFGYSTRRLKENPKMVSHIIKALFYKG